MGLSKTNPGDGRVEDYKFQIELALNSLTPCLPNNALILYFSSAFKTRKQGNKFLKQLFAHKEFDKEVEKRGEGIHCNLNRNWFNKYCT